MIADANYIKSKIRTVPDWPEKGVQFRDITPIFQDPLAVRGVIDSFAQRYLGKRVGVIAGIDARGFLLGVTIAYELNIPFVPIRKKGKLPFRTIEEEYALEYGKATVEIHEDAIQKGDRVVILDDLIATGGTMLAGAKLIQRLGGEVIETAAIIDLPDLGGSAKIQAIGLKTHSICTFSGL